MSRKDYEAIADLFNNLYSTGRIDEPAFDEGYEVAKMDIMNGLVEIFAKENERFETQRFLRACGE